jgi:hypothetical protein
MSLSLQLTPGYTFQDGDLLTPAILRLIANPKVDLLGGIGTLSITDGSVTTAKLADGALSADALGQAKMANGFLLLQHIAAGIFTADAAGWAPFEAGWLPLSLVGSGIFIPTPAGRAPFAAGLVDATMMQPDAYWYGVGSGTGAAYVVTFTPTLASYVDGSGGQAFTAYWDGLLIAFKAPATCAAAATLKESSLAIIKGVYRLDGTAVQAGDILTGSIIELRYNTNLNSGAGGWQLTTPPATPLLPFYRAGTATVAGATPLVVAFSSAVPNTNYAVVVTMSSLTTDNTVVPFVTSRTVNGFTLNQFDTATANSYNWIALPTL